MGCEQSKDELEISTRTAEYLEKLHREWERQAKERKMMEATFQKPALSPRKNVSSFYNSGVPPSSSSNGAPVFKPPHNKLLKDLREHGMINVDDIYEQLHRFDKVCAFVEHNFPGSKNSKAILHQADRILTRYNINSSNTLYAQSVCPDEINHLKGDITNLFSNYFGDVFHLGGLAGIPFTGQTGFSAFSHHVPDNGKLFILIAPHIGVSDSLHLGQYSRRGQTCDGAACGAAVGAYKYCLSGKPVPDEFGLGSNPSDYQQCFIISEVHKVIDKITAVTDENTRQVILVQEMFNSALKFLDDILEKSDDFGTVFTQVVILGGIQINMPIPLTDYFQPLLFQIRARKSTLKDAKSGRTSINSDISDSTLTSDRIIDLMNTFNIHYNNIDNESNFSIRNF